MVDKRKKGAVKRFALSVWIGEAIGRIALPIRGKLLIAFVGIVCLMIGLATAGMYELQKSNQRAAALVDEQVRISSLRAFADTVHSVKLSGVNLFAGTDSVIGSDPPLDQFNKELRWMRSALAGQIGIDRASSFLEIEQIPEINARIREIATIGGQIATLHAGGDVQAAREVFSTVFLLRLEALDARLFSRYFEMRERMRFTAQASEDAFQRSRQFGLAASALAVLLALAVGFSISTSILQPLEQIRAALFDIEEGKFTTRAEVANRDELGELAMNVNKMSQRLGELYDEVDAQRVELAGWNRALEDKVAHQVEQIERANRLRRYLPDQVADLIVGSPDEAEILRTQRAEITVLFADMRGFTAFASAAPPDQVIAALNTFHEACGPLVQASGGTLERFLGDGLVVLFGAPVRVENAAQRAVELAKEMRASVRTALASFRAGTREHRLGVGIGVATGASTLGQIGFEGRLDYSAIGPASNLAARLCDMAEDGQILISHATAWQVDCAMAPAGPFDLKGIGENIAAFSIDHITA